MRKLIRYFLIAALAGTAAAPALAQASLFSAEEPYLRLMELEGRIVRPYLEYRSLSDEKWDGSALSSEWSAFPKGNTYAAGPLSADLYLPDTFLSYNSDYPHGMNDGALWQGVGLNATTTAGAKVEAYGFSVTVKPEVHYSQNSDFDIMPSAYPSEYGYFWACGIDLYQRPGADAVYDWSWGDSEVRYTWKSATIGFGTQAVWLGPGENNALILSNNAASFPKLDFGVTKTAVPRLGQIEARVFWGKLSESDWYDDDSSNDENLISVLALAWSPSFFPELTLGVNRSLLVKWDALDRSTATAIFKPNLDTGTDEGDQRFSVTGEMLFPAIGLRLWGEAAWNDFYRTWDTFIRYPFHTIAYTAGLEKAWRLPSPRYALMVQGEISSTESSRDTAVYWAQTFYAHHIVTQGYTNEGQCLGAGYGSGGNYQKGTATLFHPDGAVSAYIQRLNRNSDYIYFLNAYSGLAAQTEAGDRWKQNAEFTLGLDTSWILRGIGIATAGIAYNMNHNPLYNNDGKDSTVLDSVYLTAGLKILLSE